MPILTACTIGCTSIQKLMCIERRVTFFYFQHRNIFASQVASSYSMEFAIGHNATWSGSIVLGALSGHF